jgi:hypothetical protein
MAVTLKVSNIIWVILSGVVDHICQQHRVLLRCYTQLIVELVMPNVLHVIPVAHKDMVHQVFQGQEVLLPLDLHLAYFKNWFLVVSTMAWSANSQNGTYTLCISYTSNFTNLGAHLLIKMMKETWLNDSWNSQLGTGGLPVTPRSVAWLVRESRHAVWRD